MTTKHTPGPWDFNVWMVAGKPTGELTVSGPNGDEHICTVDGNEDNAANGRLIAAAPETAAERDRLKEITAELLAALKSVEAHCADYWLTNGAVHEGLDRTRTILLDTARDAIAKATA